MPVDLAAPDGLPAVGHGDACLVDLGGGRRICGMCASLWLETSGWCRSLWLRASGRCRFGIAIAVVGFGSLFYRKVFLTNDKR